jgi:hypothetical protein
LNERFEEIGEAGAILSHLKALSEPDGFRGEIHILPGA